MAKDWAEEPEAREWLTRALTKMVPLQKQSAIVLSLLPEKVETEWDVKYAVELGVSILLNKPIVLIAQPGAKIPKKLALVADRIVFADVRDPDGKANLQAAISDLLEKVE